MRGSKFFLAGQNTPDYSRNWIDHLKVNQDTIEKVHG